MAGVWLQHTVAEEVAKVGWYVEGKNHSGDIYVFFDWRKVWGRCEIVGPGGLEVTRGWVKRVIL
jgi:hypothetical protein